MTTTAPGASTTARSFLFGRDGTPPVPEPQSSGLGLLTRSAGESLRGELGTVLAGMLEIELVDMLLGGWRKYGALVDAAESTLDDSTPSAVVDLATHRVSVDYEPRVDVTVDEVVVAHVDAKLTVVFDITGLVATVRGGALVALRGGSCTVTARLTLERVEVASRSATMDLSAQVPLGAGIPLVERAPHRRITLPQQEVPGD